MIDQLLLDELWDFGDAEGSATRFAVAASDPSYSLGERLELATQHARALGLQQRFDDAQAMLDGLGDVQDPAAEIRIALETGRLRSSAGAASEAIAHFEEAVALANAADAEFLELNALHMLAITDREHSTEWAERGIRRARGASALRTGHRLVSLNNDLGGSGMDEGRPESALESFREASVWAGRAGTTEQFAVGAGGDR